MKDLDAIGIIEHQCSQCKSKTTLVDALNYQNVPIVKLMEFFVKKKN